MGIEQTITELQKASAEQTAASQALSQEVAGKMGAIDEKVVAAQNKFDELVGGDFDVNVNRAKAVRIFIDPIHGDDKNSGLTSENSIKTSERFNVLANRDYDFVRMSLRIGSQFNLMHVIKAKREILIEGWNPNDGSTEKPIVKQGRANYSGLVAPTVSVVHAQIHTYSAHANETLPDVWAARAFFGSGSCVGFIYSVICVYDNQLFHVHDGGSGDYFHRRSISFYQSQLQVLPSAAGVARSQKKIFSRFASHVSLAVDMFASVLTVELNGQHATFRDSLGIPDTNVITNINLDMS